MKKKILLTLGLAVLFSLIILPCAVYADTYYPADGDTVDLANYAYTTNTVSTHRFVVSSGYTVTFTNGISDMTDIVIYDGGTAILDDAFLDNQMPGSPEYAIIGISGANFNIVVAGSGRNSMVAGSTTPGIYVPETSTVNISGSGELVAVGGDGGSGIGGANGQANCGTINITDATVRAHGGTSASAIGGGNNGGNGTTVNISGNALVLASGHTSATDIGAGVGGSDDGTINISDYAEVFLFNNNTSAVINADGFTFEPGTLVTGPTLTGVGAAYNFTSPVNWEDGTTGGYFIERPEIEVINPRTGDSAPYTIMIYVLAAMALAVVSVVIIRKRKTQK